MKHYTEQEIQEYLERKGYGSRGLLSGHFIECDDCRRSLETYNRLYKGLAVPPKMTLSARFNAAVLQRLGREPAASSKNIWSILPIALCLIAGLVAVALLYGPAVLGSVSEVATAVNRAGLKIKGLGGNLTGEYKMLPIGIVAFIIIFIFDKILQKKWAIGR
jgi:hypothetical protein